jgi:nitrite reductase/ring-hydroxylating ferredoxin subunit/uncharacterized membrane protein
MLHKSMKACDTSVNLYSEREEQTMCDTCGCRATIAADGTIELTGHLQASVDAPPQTEQPPAVERISDSLQNLVKGVIGSNRRPPRRFKSLLHGTWLRHPLHPLLSDVPIGAWVIGAVFDVIWLIVPGMNAWSARAAEGAVIVGIAGALGAAVTGLADWSDSYGSERRVGLWHALLNTTALLLYIVSLVLRLQVGSGESVPAAVVGFVGVVTVAVAGYLGGEMVFGKGTGVNHTAWEAAGEEYEAVLPVEQMAENQLRRVMVAGVPVVLLRLGEQYCAISAACSHAGGPLDEGELDGEVVTCPWHGSRFSMRTGRALTGPASIAQPRYDVRVRNGQIELKRLGGH